jgi:hypothetical protein
MYSQQLVFVILFVLTASGVVGFYYTTVHHDARSSEHQNFKNYFFPKITPFFEIMWTNWVQPDWPQKAMCRLRFACWISEPTDPLRTCSTYCSSTTIMVTRKHLNDTLIGTSPVFSQLHYGICVFLLRIHIFQILYIRLAFVSTSAFHPDNSTTFRLFSQKCIKGLLVSSYLLVHMEELDSHWKNIHEI